MKTFCVYMFCTYHVCLTFTNVVMYLIRRLPLSAKNAKQHCTPNCNIYITYNMTSLLSEVGYYIVQFVIHVHEDDP